MRREWWGEEKTAQGPELEVVWRVGVDKRHPDRVVLEPDGPRGTEKRKGESKNERVRKREEEEKE